MSRISFENYGIRASNMDNFTAIAGRHAFQENEEKRIVMDIYNKMIINTDDNCLEIGCGSGNLLIPLSFFVETITGIDHELCIDKLKNRYPDLRNIKLIPGNFFDVKIEEKFDKIIIYSVLHYLKNEIEVKEFIFKALGLLKDGGKLLLGDIPNNDKKVRFNNSKFGMEFQKEYINKVEGFKDEKPEDNNINCCLNSDDEVIKFQDNFLMSILKEVREKGFNAYILPQMEGLPYNHTREDILIEKLK